MILETKNLTKRFYGVKALDSVSLGFEKGKITGLVGPNGSGKSTLVNSLTGIVRIDDGTVFVEGIKIKKIISSEVSEYGITRTFQEIRLFNQMSVMDNILLALTERNVFGALFSRHQPWQVKKAEGLLELAEISEKKHELAQNLSYGQRKLLEILRALAMNAEVTFFDEPFSGLSPRMVEVLKKILVEMRVEGKTIVIIEHNMDLIRELCDWVFVLDGGVLLAEGKPNRVLQEEKVIEAYLGK